MLNVIARVLAGALLAGLSCFALAQAPDTKGWVTAWVTAMQDPLPTGFPAGNPALNSPQWAQMFPEQRANDQTFRLVVRPLAGGDRIRLRFSNLMGDKPVSFDNVSVAQRDAGRQVVAATSKRVLFNRANTVTIQPGREAFSDVLDFVLAPERDIAVSFHLAGASGAITWHAKALVTSYMNGAGGGDQTADPSGAPLTHEIRSWMWLAEVQAWQPNVERSTIVALGDSITDGSVSTIDGHDRWPDFLNKRLRAAGSKHVVVNQGIGGNRISALRWGPVIMGAIAPAAVLHDMSGAMRTPNARCEGCGAPAIVRLERDVFALPNVSAIILVEGVNDIGSGASYGEIIAGMQDIVLRARARGIKVYGSTITPYYGFAYDIAIPDLTRRQVNNWIRNSKTFDAVFDLDAVMRDPDYPARLKADLGAPDRIHPNPKGYAAIADSIPLWVLDDKLPR